MMICRVREIQYRATVCRVSEGSWVGQAPAPEQPLHGGGQRENAPLRLLSKRYTEEESHRDEPAPNTLSMQCIIWQGKGRADRQ